MNLPQNWEVDLLKKVNEERIKTSGERPVAKKNLFIQDITTVSTIPNHLAYIINEAYFDQGIYLDINPTNTQNTYFVNLSRKFEDYRFKELRQIILESVNYYQKWIKKSFPGGYLADDIFLVKIFYEGEYKSPDEEFDRMCGMMNTVNESIQELKTRVVVLEIRKFSLDRRPEDPIIVKKIFISD